MKEMFASDSDYIWPDNKGNTLGESIEPFYPKQVEAAKQDEVYYKLLALVDVIRIGRVREVKYAIEELKKYLL